MLTALHGFLGQWDSADVCVLPRPACLCLARPIPACRYENDPDLVTGLETGLENVLFSLCVFRLLCVQWRGCEEAFGKREQDSAPTPEKQLCNQGSFQFIPGQSSSKQPVM